MSLRTSTARPRPFELPLELSESVPREVMLTGGGVTVLVVAAALAIAAIASAVVLSVAYSNGLAQRELRVREGVETAAVVSRVTPRNGEERRLVVSYRYSADGRRFEGRTTRRANAANPIAPGNPLTVKYLRSRPETSWAIGDEPGGLPLAVIPVVTLSLLAGAVAIVWAVRRQWILLSEGRVAAGRIKDVKKIAGHEGRTFRLKYEFETLGGGARTRQYDSTKGSQPVGSLVPVIYHRDNPGWSRIYPLQLVRPVRRAARR
jgi:Protein of unknown function (DUF3592)